MNSGLDIRIEEWDRDCKVFPIIHFEKVNPDVRHIDIHVVVVSWVMAVATTTL